MASMLYLRKSMEMLVESKRGHGLPGTKNPKKKKFLSALLFHAFGEMQHGSSSFYPSKKKKQSPLTSMRSL